MLHILLHIFVPVIVGRLFYKKNWTRAIVLMLAGMLIDLDHLLADPIYNPDRCSIGFHPLHTAPLIVLYSGLFVMPIITEKWLTSKKSSSLWQSISLVGLGLIIHIVLDALDCIV